MTISLSQEEVKAAIAEYVRGKYNTARAEVYLPLTNENFCDDVEAATVFVDDNASAMPEIRLSDDDKKNIRDWVNKKKKRPSDARRIMGCIEDYAMGSRNAFKDDQDCRRGCLIILEAEYMIRYALSKGKITGDEEYPT